MIFNILFSEIKFEEFTKCLNIPNDLKFGIELEYCNVSFECIKKLFTTNMILSIMNAISIPKDLINHIIRNNDFEKKNEFNKWIFSKELINDDYPEVSSPIMTNTLDNLNEIKAMCTLFNAVGVQTNGGTGLHINVGVDYFKGKIDALKYLIIIWSECEKLFFKIANEENEEIRVMSNTYGNSN